MLRALIVPFVVIAASGCLDVCSRAELMNGAYPKRHRACFPEGALGNAPFDGARCDESMKACSEGEERALQAYFDCLDRLPVCTPDTKPQFNEAVLACASGMQSLSPGCFVP